MAEEGTRTRSPEAPPLLPPQLTDVAEGMQHARIIVYRGREGE